MKIGFLHVLSRTFPLYEGKPLSLLQISIGTGAPVEFEIVRVVSLSKTEKTEITRVKKKTKNDLQGLNTLIHLSQS